jgi:hypothetical protein
MLNEWVLFKFRSKHGRIKRKIQSHIEPDGFKIFLINRSFSTLLAQIWPTFYKIKPYFFGTHSVVEDGLKIKIFSQVPQTWVIYFSPYWANFGIHDAILTHKYLSLFDSIKPILRICPQNDLNESKTSWMLIKIFNFMIILLKSLLIALYHVLLWIPTPSPCHKVSLPPFPLPTPQMLWNKRIRHFTNFEVYTIFI